MSDSCGFLYGVWDFYPSHYKNRMVVLTRKWLPQLQSSEDKI